MGNARSHTRSFIDVDRRSIDVRDASFASISHNVFRDVGGRSAGNPAGVLIGGSNKNVAILYFINNTISQTREILDDKTNSHINPGKYVFPISS